MNTEIWFPNTFQISEYCPEHGLSMKTVSGLTNNGFGVHWMKNVWTVTHLKSGWRCFACKSEEGAIVIGEYLIENYAALFDGVKTCGAQVENAKNLRRKIRADEELANLRKLFALSESEMRRLSLIPSIKVEIIS